MRLSALCLLTRVLFTAPLGFALSVAAGPAYAQHAAPSPATTPPAAGKDAKVHKVQKLADNVYCIFGQGGNIGLVVTAQHAVLIDDQFAPLVPGLIEAVHSVTSKPIKYLINTHWHPDHTGGNIALEKQVMAIVAHTNTRKRLEEEQAKKPEAERGGLPELVVGESDPTKMARLDIHLGGVDMHLVHYKAGHTDGDVIIGLPQSHVMHMGDLFFNHKLPVVDVKHGGSLEGILANVEWVLGFIPEDTKIIPGHGEVATKKDLQRYRDFIVAVLAHLKAHPGKSAKELDASFDHKTWSDVEELKPFLSWEKFFGVVTGQAQL